MKRSSIIIPITMTLVVILICLSVLAFFIQNIFHIQNPFHPFQQLGNSAKLGDNISSFIQIYGTPSTSPKDRSTYAFSYKKNSSMSVTTVQENITKNKEQIGNVSSITISLSNDPTRLDPDPVFSICENFLPDDSVLINQGGDYNSANPQNQTRLQKIYKSKSLAEKLPNSSWEKDLAPEVPTEPGTFGIQVFYDWDSLAGQEPQFSYCRLDTLIWVKPIPITPTCVLTPPIDGYGTC